MQDFWTGSIWCGVWGLVFGVWGSRGFARMRVFFLMVSFDFVFKRVFEATFGGNNDGFLEELLKRVFQVRFGWFLQGSFA